MVFNTTYTHSSLYTLMAGKEQIAIDRKVTLDELNSFVKHENNPRVYKRLYFIKFWYLGDSMEEATNKGVTKKQGINGMRIRIGDELFIQFLKFNSTQV